MESTKTTLLAHLAMLYAACAFGALTIMIKWALTSDVNPLVFCMLRDVIAAPLLAVAAGCSSLHARSRSQKKDDEKVLVGGTSLPPLLHSKPEPSRREWGLLCLAGLTGE